MKFLLVAILLVFALPLPGIAQTAGGPFAPRPNAAATQDPGPTAETPGLFRRAIAAVLREQRQFHRKLAAALEDVRSEGAMAAAWTLIVTSFLYGVFHAAGPGHGKAILTAYLATQRERMRRGILLSAAAAFVQGLVAIVLVFVLTWAAGWAARDTQAAVRWAEQFSFALVAVLGGYLLVRAAKALWRLRTDHTKTNTHHHGHDHGDAADHVHCGHTHMPTPDQLAGARDFKAMAGVVLSIGIRPCSGAVLVLVVANVFGIAWAGLAAVGAMSFGTALAVATLALAVLSARRLVAALVGRDTPGLAMVAQMVALLGGATILILGLTLLAGSFGPAHPLGL